MTIHFSECSSAIEVMYFVVVCILILTSIVGGLRVYTNEKEMAGKEAVLNEVLSGVSVFFTGRFLNDTGKKWRPLYVFSVIGLIVLILAGLYFKPCT